MSIQSLSRDLEIQTISFGGALTDQGAYNALTNYVLDDVVTSAGVTYRALKATVGETPASTPASWAVMPAANASAVTIVALSDALKSGFTDLAATRQSRRKGLLEAVATVGALPCGTSSGSISEAWDEVLESKAYLAAVTSYDHNFDAYRAVEQQVRSALTDPIPTATRNIWAAQLISSAADYLELSNASLPA